MLLRFIILLLCASIGWAQSGYESALTNKPIPYSSTILIPQAAIPGVVIPQSTTPSPVPADVIAPPVSGSLNSKPFGRYGLPPSTADFSRQPLQAIEKIPQQPVGVRTTNIVSTVDTNEPGTVTGGQFLFVDAAGSDQNNGTKSAPWKTLQRAAQDAQPGDVVIVRPGTYEAFHTIRGGEPTKPITFRALANVIVVPQGGEAPDNQRLLTVQDLYKVDNIHIQACNYVVIEGFQIQKAGWCGIFVADSRGVILRNNVIGPVGRFGILTGFATDIQIVSNKTFGAIAEHGIYVSNSREDHDNPVVRFNESYGNHGAGIQVNGDCRSGGDGSITGALIEGNVVHDNDLNGMSLISMSDSVVQNNLVYQNGKHGGAGGMHFTDEVGCDKASRNNVIVNNTIVEPNIVCVRFTEKAQQNIFFNNLLVGPRPLVDEVEDNKIDKSSNVQVDAASGVFYAPETGDYHLLPTSPARNAGLANYQQKTAPTTDREGNLRHSVMTFDAGAY